MGILLLRNLKNYSEIRDHVEKTNGWIFRSEYLWWIILDDNENWVAYAGLSHFNRKTLYLGPTFVKEQCRGQGLQSYLIRLRESYAKCYLDAEGLITFVEKTNTFSAKNLSENGFIIVDTDVNYYPDTYECFTKRFN